MKWTGLIPSAFVAQHHRSGSQHCRPFATGELMASGGGGCSGTASGTEKTTKSRRLFSFEEARKIARGHGFESKEEFVDYTCPGAYQIPKDADVVWKDVSAIGASRCTSRFEENLRRIMCCIIHVPNELCMISLFATRTGEAGRISSA